jgi:hypothetical protein
MQIVKLTSITKKLAMGALGAFLLIFLPAHMGMNLCIIRSDGGEWYRNVCHFMGTNYIVKIFEVVLLAIIIIPYYFRASFLPYKTNFLALLLTKYLIKQRRILVVSI